MPGLSVALVSEHASPLVEIGGVDAGGQNVYIRALAIELGKRGHTVTVYTRRTAASAPTVVELDGNVRIVHVDAGPPATLPKEDLAVLMGEFGDQLALHWQDNPPDLAHAHYWMSGAAVLRGVHRSTIPLVQTFHASASDRLSVLKEPRLRERERERLGIERTVAQTAAHLVALTSGEASELKSEFRIPAHRISVVPCGVDLARFRPTGPTAARSTRPRLLSVGRLVARKGVDTIVEALAHVPDAELLIAGGPPAASLGSDSEYVRLQRAAARFAVTERVRFLGQTTHDAIPDLLRSADIFVTAPLYEPFGMAALEAAACGLPIVATDVGGLKESVIEGVTGYRVPPARPGALAERIRDLLNHPERRRSLGATAARRAQRYSWDRIADQIATVYRSVLRG